MKRVMTLFGRIGAVAIVALAVGCMTAHQTENLLSEAGFKIVPATTPQQQAHLKTLPAGKVTIARREGTTYYVYPDAARQVIYVGKDVQYQHYLKLCRQHETAEPGLNSAEVNNEPGWGPWGAWQGSW